MRTTLDLDRTALEAARQLAAHRAQSLGSVVSELILKGLQTGARAGRKGAFPVFGSAVGKPITLDDVKSAEDEA
jgi:ABC-type spermidine/putrescine transport system permease subunit I